MGNICKVPSLPLPPPLRLLMLLVLRTNGFRRGFGDGLLLEGRKKLLLDCEGVIVPTLLVPALRFGVVVVVAVVGVEFLRVPPPPGLELLELPNIMMIEGQCLRVGSEDGESRGR